MAEYQDYCSWAWWSFFCGCLIVLLILILGGTLEMKFKDSGKTILQKNKWDNNYKWGIHSLYFKKTNGIIIINEEFIPLFKEYQ